MWFFEADLDDAGPVAALEKTRHGTADEFGAFATAFLEKIVNLAADDLLVGETDEVRKAAVHGANFALERESHKDVVEGIDEVAIALLGTGDDGEELIDLFFAGRNRIALLDTADKAAEFGDFAVALPGVDDEDGHDKKQKREKRLEARGRGLLVPPGTVGRTKGI